MISSTGNSLLAAQMYDAAASQVSTRKAAPAPRPEFEKVAKEAREINSRPEKSRSFPVDRIQVSPEPALAQETALIAQEEQQRDLAAEDASRFAREAPGTEEPRRYELPGSRLDITI